MTYGRFLDPYDANDQEVAARRRFLSEPAFGDPADRVKPPPTTPSTEGQDDDGAEESSQ